MQKLLNLEGEDVVFDVTDVIGSDCDICALAKSRQQNHPNRQRRESLNRWDWRSDPFVANFTDDLTRMNSACVLRNKRNAMEAFIRFNREVLIPSGHRLHRLRSDHGGGEHRGKEHRDY